MEYAREIATLRAIGNMSQRAELVETLAKPVAAAIELWRGEGGSNAAKALVQLCELRSNSMFVARRLVRATCTGNSKALKRAWLTADELASTQAGSNTYTWRLVYGVPVVCEPWDDSTWYAAPEPAGEIFARIRDLELAWRIVDGGLVEDTRTVPEHMCENAAKAVARTRLFDSCRAWIFAGPPGGGKSVAARQVMAALAGASVTVPPESATDPDVWSVVEAARPDGIIIDDIDSVADKDVLLDRLERAREYARVVISTANTLDDLRGALVRPGRAADEDVLLFPAPDATTVSELAPTAVASGADLRGLLACYLTEAEARAKAGTPVDVEGLRRRMEAVGDR